MAKAKLAYVCQSCGTTHVRWQGRCEGCGEWNSIVESGDPTAARKGRS